MHPVTKVVSSLLPLIQDTRNLLSSIRQPRGCLHFSALISSSMGLIIKGAFRYLFVLWVCFINQQLRKFILRRRGYDSEGTQFILLVRY
jgi:hypothetical protein